MKKLLTTVLYAACLLVICLPAKAQFRGASYYFSTSASGTTLASAIVSAKFGTPRLQYLNVTGDNATNQIIIYTASAATPATLATNASQAVFWCVPTSITNNNIVVVRHVGSDTYERLKISSATSSNVTFTTNLGTAVALGDTMYLETPNPAIPLGNATVEKNGTGSAIWNGVSRMPLLIDATGASAVTINACSGTFDTSTP